MKKLIIVLFLFLASAGMVSAEEGECADTDDNEYILLAQEFERFLLERCEVEQESDLSTQYSCPYMTESFPAGFRAMVFKNEKYWSIFVLDKSRMSSFLTILDAPLILGPENPVGFYGPKDEVIGKMKEVVTILSGFKEVNHRVVYDVHF